MLDYIIVGQGIAGSVLGLELLQQGKKIMIIDEENKVSSSNVAAGIFNPVTGKRKARTWDAEKLFDTLKNFYPALEQRLASRFYYEKPVYMLFDSIEEQNSWAGKIADPMNRRFLDVNLDTNRFESVINDPFGGILANISGYVDLNVMLDGAKRLFKEQDSFLNEKVDHIEIDVSERAVSYKSIEARKIIFCEGYESIYNPFFSWLPFNLVKGELLYIEVDGMPDVIFNKNIFILPLSEGKCVAGATYQWDTVDLSTTQEARAELISKIDLLLKVPYKVTGQKAGIRPATTDRRPFFGVHPRYENVSLFGGLGTKGVSIVPYYAGQFIEFLENQKELEKDVNISRHYSLYFSNNK